MTLFSNAYPSSSGFSGPFMPFRKSKKRGRQAKNSDFSSKNEEFAPEGFQRAIGKPFGRAVRQNLKLKKAHDSPKTGFLACLGFA